MMFLSKEQRAKVTISLKITIVSSSYSLKVSMVTYCYIAMTLYSYILIFLIIKIFLDHIALSHGHIYIHVIT